MGFPHKAWSSLSIAFHVKDALANGRRHSALLTGQGVSLHIQHLLYPC